MASQYQLLKEILSKEPKYRQNQVQKAWFDWNISGYDQITTLPVTLREELKGFPWFSVNTHTLLTSKEDNTRKVLLELHDKQYVEMVIMGRENIKKDAGDNAPDRYTICVSCQAGCPMKCAFCATGKQGFKRNLSAQEIVDQYRYAQKILVGEGARVANIVFMGQGEPMLNYENVKEAIKILLENTDLGETKITVSTAGVVPAMEKMLTDDFPPVRWALSLHSAIEESRKQIMPSNPAGFLEFVVKWANAYDKRFPSRKHFIGLEYIMLGGVNDDEKHLQALIALAKRMPHIRINLIPYNNISDEVVDNKSIFGRTPHEQIVHWHEQIMKAGFTATIRYSQGQDIAAACGQLRNKAEM